MSYNSQSLLVRIYISICVLFIRHVSKNLRMYMCTVHTLMLRPLSDSNVKVYTRVFHEKFMNGITVLVYHNIFINMVKL